MTAATPSATKQIALAALAWDLWFDLAQSTNDFDPPYAHGVFVLSEIPPAPGRR